jgi:hypothetical protein
MAVYARGDTVSVGIPVEDGGCGVSHTRPVVNGAPAKIWKLTCPQCEQEIRRDIARSTYKTMINGKWVTVNNGLWSESQLHIPLTPDEAEVAEAMEKSGQTIMHQVAEGMSKQAIENMQRQNASEIEKGEAAQEAAAASARVAELEAQLAEMRTFMAQIAAANTPPAPPAPPVPASTTTATPKKPEVASKAARTPEKPVSAVASTTTCAGCGGPLRSPGDRGPTLKGTCRACRAKARAAAA